MVAWVLAAVTIWLAAVAAPPATQPAPPSATVPAYEPTSRFEVREVEGWKVYVHRDVLARKAELWGKAEGQLRAQFHNIGRVVPAPALAKLRRVPIWIEDNPKVAGMCYHPSRRWLEQNGFNPEKARCVELGRLNNFVAWTAHQPWMVLHELAHAYHHQVLGYDHAGIKAAFAAAVEAKSYERVLRYDGKKARHYALSNDQEYFAEGSEAFFGTNDFYPFVRAELKEHDPKLLEVMEKVWK